MFGISRQAAQNAIRHGCPPFIEPPPGTREPPTKARPPWSYPDRLTLGLVRDIKKEMERGQ
jgi:hypothetical protein